MKETDIVNSEKFKKTKDFTIYKKRSNKLFPCVELTNWHYKVIPYYKLILYGNNGEKNIISSQVIDVKQGIVQTINTPYKLIGNMSEFCDPFPGFDPKIFEFGIPDDFSEKIKDEMIKLNSIKKEKNYFEGNKSKKEENKSKNEENKSKKEENKSKKEENKIQKEENKIEFDSEKIVENKEMTKFQEEEFILNTFKPTLLEKKEEIKNSPKIQEFKNENYIFEAKDKTVEKEFSITNSIFKNNPLLSRIAKKEILEESFVKKPKIEEKTEEISEEKILEDENSTTGYVEEEISTEKSVNLQINQPIIVKEAQKNFDLTNLGTVKDTVFKINEGLVKKDIDEKQVKENAMKRFEEVSKQEIKEKKFIDEYLFKKTVQLPVNLDISEESSDKSKEEIKSDSSLGIELKEEKIIEENKEEIKPEEPKEEFNNEELKEEIKEEQPKEKQLKEEEINTTQEEIFLLSQEMKKESENFAKFFKEAKKEKFEIENKFIKNKIFPKKISAKSVRIKKKVSPKKENEIKEEKEKNEIKEEKEENKLTEEKEDQIKEEINEERKPVSKTKKIVKKKRKPITFQGRKK